MSIVSFTDREDDNIKRIVVNVHQILARQSFRCHSGAQISFDKLQSTVCRDSLSAEVTGVAQTIRSKQLKVHLQPTCFSTAFFCDGNSHCNLIGWISALAGFSYMKIVSRHAKPVGWRWAFNVGENVWTLGPVKKEPHSQRTKIFKYRYSFVS